MHNRERERALLCLGGNHCRSSGSSCGDGDGGGGGGLDGLLLGLPRLSLLGQEDHVDVVVDALQQQLALEGHDGALLGGSEGPHEGLDWLF